MYAAAWQVIKGPAFRHDSPLRTPFGLGMSRVELMEQMPPFAPKLQPLRPGSRASSLDPALGVQHLRRPASQGVLARPGREFASLRALGRTATPDASFGHGFDSDSMRFGMGPL
jgi:hypothetical protein